LLVEHVAFVPRDLRRFPQARFRGSRCNRA
jgi:hypothetical protein